MFKTPPKSPLTEVTSNKVKRTPPSHNIPSRSESDIRKLYAEEALQLNVTQRNKRKHQTEITSVELETFKNELKEMMREMISANNSRLDKLEGHITGELEKSLTSVSDQLSSLESKITSLEKERSCMVLKLSALEEKLEVYDRNIIKTSIEIRNVPKQEKESKAMLYQMVQCLSKKLDTSSELTNIRDIIRQPSKKENKTSSITVEFSNTLNRSNFLTAVKEYNKKNSNNKISSTHLGITSTPQTPIYVAEQLTTLTKRLFYLARNYAKSNQYSYCWTSNGRVLLKKDTDSQAIMVKNEQQLKQLAQTVSA
ncbi:hypothetical protein PYW08_010296 [Mythimna loreyi]|uniref:Uncharacterized protein n=1 Tax=Mythimna loreyi TaxID=667449 RepID=A0ACC2Q436_9NEOP|nr:hypothetical protein PYW08_010296 [Mythimna loreyi]